MYLIYSYMNFNYFLDRSNEFNEIEVIIFRSLLLYAHHSILCLIDIL